MTIQRKPVRRRGRRPDKSGMELDKCFQAMQMSLPVMLTLSPQKKDWRSQENQRWPESRGRDVFFTPCKSQKQKALFLSFATRSTYRWVWGRVWVSLVSLVGIFRSQFFLHIPLPLVVCFRSSVTDSFNKNEG